ncbi:MAG TPA: protein-L-isoaspartate(D-aspartate) O-methyltransferase [Trebonia sp.]|nr:protein-L-isoaspartate(D-aspartate) O-methyltransferase [Trebonia sp.]
MSPVTGPEKLAVAARAVGVTDPRVLEAIRRTPRAAFVPEAYAGRAYDDVPVPIPHGQVTTQPSLSAAMIAALGLTGAEEVFEVGTGYGYQTALLARLAARVVSIDIWPDLAARARRNLAAQGIGNLVVLAGDGTAGAPDFAPFDAIVVSAAGPRVPSPLAAQLRTGGRLVQPIGPGGAEDVVLYEKGRDGMRRVRVLTAANFVPLHGRYGVARSQP